MFFRKKKKEEKLEEVITAEVVEEETGWKKQSLKSIDEIEKKIDRMDSKAEWKLKKRFETKFGERLETPTEKVLKEEVVVEVPKVRKEKISAKKIEKAIMEEVGIEEEKKEEVKKEVIKEEVKPKVEVKEVKKVEIPVQEVVPIKIVEKRWYNIRQLYLTRKKQPKGIKKILFIIIDIFLWAILLIPRVLYLPIRAIKKRKEKKVVSETTTQKRVEVLEKRWYNIRQLYLTRKKQPKGAKKILFIIIDIFLWAILLIPRVLYLPIRAIKKRKEKKVAIDVKTT